MKKLILSAIGLGAALGAQATVHVFSGAGLEIPTSGSVTRTFNVGALDGPVIDVDFRFNGLTHSFPDDFGALLLGPTGAYVVLFDGAGGGDPLGPVDWTFDDEAAGFIDLINNSPSGSYRPATQYPGDVFSGSGVTDNPPNLLLSAFDGQNPEGVWTLFVEDFVAGDGGNVDSFDLIITTDPVPEPATMVALGLGLAAMRRRKK